MSQPTTPTSQPMTMHFEAATPTLTAAEQLSVVVAQMASLTTMLETMQTTQVETLKKHKRDLTNQVKADVIISTADLETRVETIDAKVALVESDMQQTGLDIDDLEAFKDEYVPKIDQAIIRPESSPAPSDDRNTFPRFSGYMGTRTTLQRPVSPDEYYKFVLPAGASSTSSY
eukprot:scaffold94771_cov41-Attheya_sp.AAC.1